MRIKQTGRKPVAFLLASLMLFLAFAPCGIGGSVGTVGMAFANEAEAETEIELSASGEISDPEETPAAEQTEESSAQLEPEADSTAIETETEATAPEGYVLAGYEQTAQSGYDPDGHTAANPSAPVYIEFTNNTPVYLSDADEDVLEVVQYNEQQKGKVSIAKSEDVPVSMSMSMGMDGNIFFAYDDEPLEGAVFEIVADGDIVSQDGSGTVLYTDGEVVRARSSACTPLRTSCSGHRRVAMRST